MIKLGRIEFKLLETRDNEYVKSIIEESEFVIDTIKILNFKTSIYRHTTFPRKKTKPRKPAGFAWEMRNLIQMMKKPCM